LPLPCAKPISTVLKLAEFAQPQQACCEATAIWPSWIRPAIWLGLGSQKNRGKTGEHPVAIWRWSRFIGTRPWNRRSKRGPWRSLRPFCQGQGIEAPELDGRQLAAVHSTEPAPTKDVAPPLLDLLEANSGQSASLDLREQAVLGCGRLDSSQQGRKVNGLAKTISRGGHRSCLESVWGRGRSLASQDHPGELPARAALRFGRLVPRTGAQRAGWLGVSHGPLTIPRSFEALGEAPGSHGYTVLIPRHPAATSQQRSMASARRKRRRPNPTTLIPLGAAWDTRQPSMPLPRRHAQTFPPNLRHRTRWWAWPVVGGDGMLQLAGRRAQQRRRFHQALPGPAQFRRAISAGCSSAKLPSNRPTGPAR